MPSNPLFIPTPHDYLESGSRKRPVSSGGAEEVNRKRLAAEIVQQREKIQDLS
jgi:hypothetical protein